MIDELEFFSEREALEICCSASEHSNITTDGTTRCDELELVDMREICVFEDGFIEVRPGSNAESGEIDSPCQTVCSNNTIYYLVVSAISSDTHDHLEALSNKYCSQAFRIPRTGCHPDAITAFSKHSLNLWNQPSPFIPRCTCPSQWIHHKSGSSPSRTRIPHCIGK